MAIQFPDELLRQFEETTFCPDDAYAGNPATGAGWNSLRVRPESGSESKYAETPMWYDWNVNGKKHEAERPFAEWSGTKDGPFVKAVIDWLQSLNPHIRDAGKEVVSSE